MSQRSRESGLFSATTGLCALLIGIVLIQIAIFYALFYAPDEERTFVTMLGDIFAMVGLAFFVIFVEIDQARGIPKNARSKYPYRYTLLVIIILAILVPVVISEEVGILDSDLRFLLMGLIIIPAYLAARRYIRRFSDMQVVKRNNAPRRFFIGLILTGFSNFLPALLLFLGLAIYGVITSYIVGWAFLITSAIIVVGSFLMASAWAQFPRFEDLQWMRNLDRLIVFEGQGGIPLFDHAFSPVEADASPEDNTKSPKNLSPALAAGAISGLDSLLGEILASEGGHINEIDYGEKKALFYRGKQAIFMLIVTISSQELLYRLEMFGLSFERQYTGDFVKLKTSAGLFQGADSLMWKYFS